MTDSRGTSIWGRFIQPQDIVWLLLFSALAAASPRRTAAELEVLTALALLQLVAPRLRQLNTLAGNLSVITLKLVLGFLLIGVTGGIASSYDLVLLLPIVSAATTLGAGGTAAFTCLACLAYLAFIPLAFRFGYPLNPPEVREVALRVIFLPVVAYLTYNLAQANRNAALRAQAAAEELSEANRRLLTAEASARRSERLAALGQLTAGLAHELRNPLGTMKASADMLLSRLQDSGDLERELLGYISSEVDRTNSLITRFLDFARPARLRLATTDLNALIDSAIERLKRQQPEWSPIVHRNYDPSLPHPEADAELLERVILNLLQNALEASPPGAGVTVKTGASGGIVEMAVIDRGPGIPRADLEQIFNPFYTTKAGGVGLGLAICAKIIDDHGGQIKVESDLGHGSSFLVRLPLSPSAIHVNAFGIDGDGMAGDSPLPRTAGGAGAADSAG